MAGALEIVRTAQVALEDVLTANRQLVARVQYLQLKALKLGLYAAKLRLRAPVFVLPKHHSATVSKRGRVTITCEVGRGRKICGD